MATSPAPPLLTSRLSQNCPPPFTVAALPYSIVMGGQTRLDPPPPLLAALLVQVIIPGQHQQGLHVSRGVISYTVNRKIPHTADTL